MKYVAFALLILIVPLGYVNAQSQYLGPINIDSLFAGYPDFAANHDRYQPDSAAVAWLAQCEVDSVDIVMVLGTWCGDSKRNSPAVFKALDEAQNPRLPLISYGIARGKQEPAEIVQKYAVAYVPTVIVYHKGQEVGRIVERPAVSMEQDLVAILKPLR